MEHLEDIGLGQQVEQRREVEARRLGVDRRRLVGRGDLDEAQVGEERVLPHELGVDGDEVGGRQAVTQGCERRGVGNQRMDEHDPT